MLEQFESLPASWRAWCAEQASQAYFGDLVKFVNDERSEHEVFPEPTDVFAALNLTPFESIRVILLGQDPYHGEGQAHGLCFSVQRGVRLPPSLRNIYKELESDLGVTPPEHGFLESWAKQGVLMLNTVLTVRAHAANSHRKKGWETFTDAIIDRINEQSDPVVFILWGKPAQKKVPRINDDHHRILMAPHPSPLSARTGFFGSKPFSQTNALLEALGHAPIDWSLPD